MKPGDIVYHVPPRAMHYSPADWIRTGVFIGPKRDSNIRLKQVRVHFGWVGVEEVQEALVFPNIDAARAHVRIELRKHLRRLRTELKKLKALDVAAVKPRDRTKQIKPRKLAELLATERAILELAER